MHSPDLPRVTEESTDAPSRDPRRIFVAATGSLFNPVVSVGYWSIDGGRSWTRVLNGSTDTTGASEVVFDPADSQWVNAVMWDHRRQPNKRTYSGVGSGTYRSVDGGTTWQRLDALVPVAGDLGRIGIGMAPSDPNRLSAVIGRGVNSTNTFAASFTSGDGTVSDRRNWFTPLQFDPKTSCTTAAPASTAPQTTASPGPRSAPS